MITNISKKIICIKDIPSNLIEEAIFILKSDNDNITNEVTKTKRKEIISKEAENLLKDYMQDMKKKSSMDLIKNDNNFFNSIKKKAVLISAFIAIIAYMIFRLF